MAKRVFFSFHYQDVKDFRANVVRNHWLTKEDREDAGFFDGSVWEATKRSGVEKLKNFIDEALDGTTVTCVLIGSETYDRRWVRYEIVSSLCRGNSVFGVHINGIKGKDGLTKGNGPNPFQHLGLRYSDDGTVLTIREWREKQWIDYADYEPWKLKTVAGQDRKGKTIQASERYRVYDWAQDDGYVNFSTWVGA